MSSKGKQRETNSSFKTARLGPYSNVKCVSLRKLRPPPPSPAASQSLSWPGTEGLTAAHAQRGSPPRILGKRPAPASSLGRARRRSGGGHFRRGVRTESGSAAAARTATKIVREKLGPVSTADQGQRALPGAAFCDLAVSPTSPAWRGKEDEGAAASSGVSTAWVAGRATAQPEGCGRIGQARRGWRPWTGAFAFRVRALPGPALPRTLVPGSRPLPFSVCGPKAWSGTSRFLASPSLVCSVFLTGVSPEQNKETWACSAPHSLGGMDADSIHRQHPISHQGSLEPS
jgi:hypothetical protein